MAAGFLPAGTIYLVDRSLHRRNRPDYGMRTGPSGIGPLGSRSLAARIQWCFDVSQERDGGARANSPSLGGRRGEPLWRDPTHTGGWETGAVIYVLPDAHALGGEISASTRTDHLLRDAIVYLTCLHESGHALGLRHTAAFADIMYSFGFGGGDIVGYFERYRRLLKTRADIAAHSGISDADRIAIRSRERQ